MESRSSKAPHIQVTIGSVESGTVVDRCKNIESSGRLDMGWDACRFSFCCRIGKCLLLEIETVVKNIFLQVTLAAITQPSLAPEARTTLLQYVTGKYLLPSNCRVEWHFNDPATVGSTMSFTVRFFQRNGNAYPICDTDQFYVEVMTEGTKKVVAISELGSSHPNNANEAKVKFTVRTAGQYKISIMIGSNHIAGSPFYKFFLPSSMSPLRSRMIRASSIVVCQAGLPNILHIEPRDEYGNVCNFDHESDPTRGYLVEIFDLNDQPNEKYSSAITLNYDKVNSRINVNVLFPEPICLRARITYEMQPIPNANFDLIVLSSCDTTLVHKNIASRKHNIAYDAKLLSVEGQSKIKSKKVICYVGPKQLTIKEMILKIIPKRIATFRLCPSTKVKFLLLSTCVVILMIVRII